MNVNNDLNLHSMTKLSVGFPTALLHKSASNLVANNYVTVLDQ